MSNDCTAKVVSIEAIARNTTHPVQAHSTTPFTPAGQSFRATQLGNAERLVSRHGDKIRYCHSWKKWLIWNGRQWRPDEKGSIYGLSKDTVLSIQGEAKRIKDEQIRANLANWARRSESRGEIEAMIALAQNDVAIAPEELDKDPLLFNCLNGTLDLNTGTLRRHERRDWLTKISPVHYDSKAECPIWLAFLGRLFEGNQELLIFLQQAIGYTLTGRVSEKALFVLHGDGDNGKTTLLEAIRNILGDYGGTVEINHLMHDASTSDQQRTIADLHGKRFITASEAEEGQRLSEAKIKHITGMARLTGRRLYSNAFEFDPLFKLFIDANHKPVIRGSDQAIWNRIKLVPFNVSIPKAQQDRHLLSKLRAEAPGILAWGVRGCLEWQRNGQLVSPRAVSDAVETYRLEMDLVRDFIEDCCAMDQNVAIPFNSLYSEYQRWCAQIGEVPISPTAFGRWLGEHGFPSVHTSSARLRQGLRIKEVPEAKRTEADAQLLAA